MRTHFYTTATSATPVLVVSATSLCIEPEVRGFVRPNVPNYVVRRLVAGTVAAIGAITIAVASIGLLASFGSTPASASEAQPALPGVSTAAMYIAQPGDTLWSIASAHRGTISHRSYLDALVSLNSSTVVQIGQAVMLP